MNTEVITDQPEHLDLVSLDIAAEKRAELLALFPEARTEGGKVDFDLLKAALGAAVDTGRERYGLTWPGKAECMQTIQAPSMATLLPAPEESVDSDTTDNLIIEGDNLEVLKLLQKSYLGKVKMIYIDPPYNTGNDFIYPDNYAESLQTYLEYTGQADDQGRKFGSNTEADGRFHSKWLNMMYPRLYLARNLLRDDGVIFISIDENELANLRKVCDEVFGPENHVEDLVWAQNTTHSQSPLYSTNHEYIVVYALNSILLQADRDSFREAKPGYQEVMKLVADLNVRRPSIREAQGALASLMSAHKKEYEAEIADLGPSLGDEAEKLDPWRGIYAYRFAEYRGPDGSVLPEADRDRPGAHVEVWQSSDASAPAAKQSATTKDPDHPNYRFYNPIHPVTGKPCPHPKTGWRWPKAWSDQSRESFDSLAQRGKIVWGVDHATVPRYKRFLTEVETNVAKSFFFDYTDGEKQVADLLGQSALFPNPKPTTLIARLIDQVCGKKDIVLDFFAGSGTTAQSVFEHNRMTGSECRFVLVQLPEPIDPKNKDQEAAAAFCDSLGMPRTISEITKERVRRAVGRSNIATSGQYQNLFEASLRSKEPNGFRVFKLAESNFKPWNADAQHDAGALAEQLSLHIDHIREGRSDLDLLYEILLKTGFPPTTEAKEITVAGRKAYSVADGTLVVCLERELTFDLIRGIADLKPERVVCLDEGFVGNDQLKTNAVQTFRAKGVPSFKTV